MEFTKLHGCGNSFIIIDDRKRRVKSGGDVARAVCSSQVGIGADGLILVRPSAKCDIRMDYFNADGSVAEMCGNGVRCLAKFAADKKIVRTANLAIETLAGPIHTRVVGRKGAVSRVTVDMGIPSFRSPDVVSKRSPAVDLKAAGRSFTFVSMGNPHAVTFVADFDFDIAQTGRKVETAKKIFPNGANVGFAQVLSPKSVRLKVWERGCGLTQACGTGACAAVAAATLHGKLKRAAIKVQVDGGELEIRWDQKSGHIFMTGPAMLVAEGRLTLEGKALRL